MLGRAFFFVGAARSDQLEIGPRPLARTDDLITIGGRALVRDGLADATLRLAVRGATALDTAVAASTPRTNEAATAPPTRALRFVLGF